MPVERIAWIFAVVISVALAVLCFLIGYSGYGWTVIAIAIAAAVNLLPDRTVTDGEAHPQDSGQTVSQ